MRIDLTGIRPDVWIQEFPGLEESVAFVAPLSQEDFSMAQGVDRPILDKAVVREALNRFLTERRPAGYYRLTELGGVFGDRLEQVQIDWYNGSGRLVKTLAADSLQIILHPKGLWGSMGSVELVLTKGAFLEAPQFRCVLGDCEFARRVQQLHVQLATGGGGAKQDDCPRSP